MLLSIFRSPSISCGHFYLVSHAEYLFCPPLFKLYSFIQVELLYCDTHGFYLIIVSFHFLFPTTLSCLFIKHYKIKWVVLFCNLQLSYIFLLWPNVTVSCWLNKRGCNSIPLLIIFYNYLGLLKWPLAIYFGEKNFLIFFSLQPQWDPLLFSFLAASITFIVGSLSINKIWPSSRIQCSNGQNFVVSL